MNPLYGSPITNPQNQPPKVFFDEEEEALHIEPDPAYDQGRYFVPDVAAEITVGNLGMLANDVAYSDGCTRDVYLKASERSSVLELAWRMEEVNEVPHAPHVLENPARLSLIAPQSWALNLTLWAWNPKPCVVFSPFVLS